MIRVLSRLLAVLVLGLGLSGCVAYPYWPGGHGGGYHRGHDGGGHGGYGRGGYGRGGYGR